MPLRSAVVKECLLLLFLSLSLPPVARGDNLKQTDHGDEDVCFAKRNVRACMCVCGLG